MAKGSATKTEAARVLARKAFVEEGLALGLVAERLGLSESSVRKYKQMDAKAGVDWDHLRLARFAGGAGSEAAFRACVIGIADSINATLEAIKADPAIAPTVKAKLLSGLADSLRKTISSAKAYSPDVALEVVVTEVLAIIGAELTKRNPAAAQVFTESLVQIQEEILKRKKAWEN